MDEKVDKASDTEPANGSGAPETRADTIDRIKQAMVTARTTLAGHSTGADPYNSSRDRRRASVWGNRKR